MQFRADLDSRISQIWHFNSILYIRSVHIFASFLIQRKSVQRKISRFRVLFFKQYGGRGFAWRRILTRRPIGANWGVGLLERKGQR